MSLSLEIKPAGFELSNNVALPNFLTSKICYRGNEVPDRLSWQTYPSDVFSLLLMQRGGMVIEDGRSTVAEVCENSWYIHYGGKLHIMNTTDGYRFCCIKFKVGSPEMMEKMFLRNGRLGINGKKTDMLVQKLTESEYSQSVASLFSYNGIFYNILAEIQECGQKTEVADNIAEQIAEYLDDHFNEPMTINSLTGVFYYSSDYILNSFKRRYGISPHKYLTKLRIDHAKVLLCSGKYKLTDIAAECGYSDYTTFYRAFVSAVEISPNQYLKEILF